MDDINNMNKMRHYHLAFNQASISTKDANTYINLLSEDTLNYITSHSFNKRLIKPIMKIAQEKLEKQDSSQEFDKIVNTIIHDKKEMLVLMNTFCS